jgi:hypothetical protein
VRGWRRIAAAEAEASGEQKRQEQWQQKMHGVDILGSESCQMMPTGSEQSLSPHKAVWISLHPFDAHLRYARPTQQIAGFAMQSICPTHVWVTTGDPGWCQRNADVGLTGHAGWHAGPARQID